MLSGEIRLKVIDGQRSRCNGINIWMDYLSDDMKKRSQNGNGRQVACV